MYNNPLYVQYTLYNIYTYTVLNTLLNLCIYSNYVHGKYVVFYYQLNHKKGEMSMINNFNARLHKSFEGKYYLHFIWTDLKLLISPRIKIIMFII